MSARKVSLFLRRLFAGCLWLAGISLLAVMTACSDKNVRERQSTMVVAASENGRIEDVTFPSAALGRSMQYRIVLPSSYLLQPQSRPRVLYLLHGRGGSYTNWQTMSHIAEAASLSSFILVMPPGDESYYLNAAYKPDSRYEDYITQDLIRDVELHYRVTTERSGRAIAGVSMGGFGAVSLALKHPEMYFFAGSLSGPMDFAERGFNFNNPDKSMVDTRLFGFGIMRRKEDPLHLIRRFRSRQEEVPFLFIACGLQDGLIDVNRAFAKRLDATSIPHIYSEASGGHNWTYWNAEAQHLLSALVDAAGVQKKS